MEYVNAIDVNQENNLIFDACFFWKVLALLT